jgi:hypothetical protein
VPFDVGDTAGAGDDDVFAPNGWLASRVGQQQQARQQQDEVDRQSGEFDIWTFRAEMGRRLSQAFGVTTQEPTQAEMQAAAEQMQQAQAAAQAYQASMGAGPAAAWSVSSGRVVYPGRAG